MWSDGNLSIRSVLYYIEIEQNRAQQIPIIMMMMMMLMIMTIMMIIIIVMLIEIFKIIKHLFPRNL